MSYSAPWVSSVRRVLQEAQMRAAGPTVVPVDIVLALLESGEVEVQEGLAAAFGLAGKVGEGPAERPVGATVDAENTTAVRFGRAARAVLQHALEEGRREHAEALGLRHLLAGLLRSEGEAAAWLRREGVTLERIREVEPSSSSARHGGPVVCIDEASEVTIYEQVVRQIREAVATSRIGPGDRLPAVRALADALGIAPGTVARAYRELERLGVVVTAGARGTRVAEPGRSFLDGTSRQLALAGLLREPVIAAYHMGADAAEFRAAVDEAMADIYGRSAID